MKILSQVEKSNSQFGQDAYLFFNVFKYWPMKNRIGFYLDSGANDFKYISNTWFFDKCLGWRGLCVEPNPQYHAGLKASRSCTLIPECLSSVKQQVNFQNSGVSGKVTGEAGSDTLKTQCSPLHDMLSRVNESSIDLWSLDVEGYELTILRGVNFSQIPVRVALIEDFWISGRQLDLHMTTNGFVKYQHLTIDSVFINREFMKSDFVSTKIWLPKTFNQDLAHENAYRVQHKSSLDCL